MYDEILEIVKEKLGKFSDVTDDMVLDITREEIQKNNKSKILSLSEKKDILHEIFSEIRRFGVIQALLDDKSVSEIMVNGCDNIFVERDGKIQKTDLRFKSKERLEYIIQKMVSEVGRAVNTLNPIVDARLSNGDRVNVVLPPASIEHPILTIRKFQNDKMKMNDLIDRQSISKEAADFLKLLVRAKYNIFISGGTGSGKTTFLNALSDFIPIDERLISIEDSAEIELKNIENWVRLETRNKNTEGQGEISCSDLIKTSLRMRPDRIIIGEVRGKETIDMLQAMNTGHDGSISTGHANSASDMLNRLESMYIQGANIELQTIKSQINSALDIIIHLTRFKDGSRRVSEITALSNLENGDYKLVDLYKIDLSNNNYNLYRTNNELPRKTKLQKN